MAITKGINSYVTVAEADAYFQGKLDVLVWELAGSSKRESALITASSVLDTLDWAGSVVNVSQPMAFPRSGSYFDPRVGYSVRLDSSSAVTRIENATVEMAFHLLNNEGLMGDTGIVRDLSIGSINLGGIIPPSRVPPVAKRLIKPMRVNRGAQSWWRAN